LKPGEIDRIVDPAVRAAVSGWIEKHGGGALSKLDPSRPEQFPFMVARDGRRVPIKRVRIRAAVRTVAIGQAERTRYVAPNSNHHMAVFEVAGRKGEPTWVGRMCTRLEAMRRAAAGLPVVDRSAVEGGRFLFTLSSGDSIEFDAEGGGRSIGVVSGVSESMVEWREVSDGRPATEIRKAGAAGGRLTRSLSGLRELKSLRVTVSPVGVVGSAGD